MFVWNSLNSKDAGWDKLKAKKHENDYYDFEEKVQIDIKNATLQEK